MLEQYERTYCDCRKCKVQCHTMPGILAPGDWERIQPVALKLGNIADPDILLEVGESTIDLPDGTHLTIPAITPALHNGACIFLNRTNGKCSIHAVAPFGCRVGNSCTDDDSGMIAERTAALLHACHSDPAYNALAEELRDEECIAAPIEERRKAYESALDAIHE